MTDPRSDVNATAQIAFTGRTIYAQDLADFLSGVPGHATLDVDAATDGSPPVVIVTAVWSGGGFR